MLAKRLGGEIVSGDAFQIYKDMSIGTAKPTAEEMDGIPHHLIDVLPVTDSYNLARYLADAKAAINDILSRQKLPIICGGTGLYISSLIDGTKLSETSSNIELRESLYALAASDGNEALHKRLMEIDPRLAKTLHPNNIGRIIRAIEVYEMTGVTQSEHQLLSKPEGQPYALSFIGLTAKDRKFLYSRIEKRVDIMISSGLVEEAARLQTSGWSVEASKAIGYKELAPYLDGSADITPCVDNLKQATRRYAKRQLTWFRRDDRINWLNIDELDADGLYQKAIEEIYRNVAFMEAYNNHIVTGEIQ